MLVSLLYEVKQQYNALVTVWVPIWSTCMVGAFMELAVTIRQYSRVCQSAKLCVNQCTDWCQIVSDLFQMCQNLIYMVERPCQ